MEEIPTFTSPPRPSPLSFILLSSCSFDRSQKKKYFYLSKTYLIILFLCDSTVSNYSCQTKAPAISRDWGVIRDVTSWSSIQVYRTRTWTARRQQSVFFSKLLCNSDAQQSLETTGLWIIQPVSVTAET